MFLRITELESKKLVGIPLQMSLSANKTTDLWKRFMPQKKLIANTIGDLLYSVQVYPDNESFNFHSLFTKWAAIEVKYVDKLAGEMEVLTIPSGLYAVFIHRGSPANFAATMKYIFEDWLANSDYSLDNRPHFECLGKKYKNNDPSSEEEVWIPIKEKVQ